LLIVLAALPLALGACSREPLYGPELPVEQTATIEHFSVSDGIGITRILTARVISIDGREIARRGSYILLPEIHTVRVEWDYDGCGPAEPLVHEIMQDPVSNNCFLSCMQVMEYCVVRSLLGPTTEGERAPSKQRLKRARSTDFESMASMGALSGTFPNISLFQNGRPQASFSLEKRK
jgi:hypothetical protein